jgi:uncharacterized protein (DUF2164 family)
MHEIAPVAYNRGVKDAETYFHAKVEDPDLIYLDQFAA